MSIDQFEGTIAYFIISRLAGGEILENYSKDGNMLQTLLEYSLNYIENFENLKSDIHNWNQSFLQNTSNFQIQNIKQISILYENLRVFITEIKEDDIFVVNFFDVNYPEGIIKMFLNEYILNVKNNYSF